MPTLTDNSSLLGSSTVFILLTGLSGSGKSQAINALEDLGYLCVDNLPVSFLESFADKIEGDTSYDRSASRSFAVVTDVRDPDFLKEFPIALLNLRRRKTLQTLLVFLEASDQTLLRRFSETRRPHPLAPNGSVLEGVAEERSRLAEIKQTSDRVFDSSNLTAHELRRAFIELSQDGSNAGLVTTFLSFGYKHGIPLESDLLFDVRFLPNPYFEPELRKLTGSDPAVISYLEKLKPAKKFLIKTSELLQFLIPQYALEGKRYLTIGVGCTGGRHRSVFIAEKLLHCVTGIRGVRFRFKHRDISRS